MSANAGLADSKGDAVLGGDSCRVTDPAPKPDPSRSLLQGTGSQQANTQIYPLTHVYTLIEHVHVYLNDCRQLAQRQEGCARSTGACGAPSSPAGLVGQHSPPLGGGRGVFLQSQPQQSPHRAVRLCRQCVLQEASSLCLQPSCSEGCHVEEAGCWGSASRTEDHLPLCPPCEQANPFSSSD